MTTHRESTALVEDGLAGVKIGDELPPIRHLITQELIDRYAAASLDFNPVHIDPDWSRRARVFGRPVPVLHGMAQMSWLCSLVLREWGATTEIFAIDGKFTKPMFLGDKITCTGIVTELHPLGGGRDYVVVAATAYNGDGEIVGVSTLSVRTPPIPPPHQAEGDR